MKKTQFIFLMASLFSLALSAQKYSISGIIIDSAGKPMEGSAVVLLNSADSSMVGFSRSKADGIFTIKNVPTGTAYTLRATFVGHDAYLQDIPKDYKGEKMDVGGIRMIPLSKMLDAATITGVRAPITFKGDTTEFNAAAFKTDPNATAEELLKKLPGVEVDKDGNIKAQGEGVTKIYVNGKKFFSNDPKIATQNLPAGAIDKVQLYDKKSDQAEFSGVDDGEREKVINFQLKDSHSQGTFGNITAGAGENNRYSAKGALNRFSRNQQLSVLGMGNNINKQGFSMEDYMSYTGASQRMMGGGGGRVTMEVGGNNSSIPLDFGRNPGFNNTWAGGLNFNKTFNPKTELNTSYFYNNSDKVLDKITDRQNFLPTRTYSTNSKSNSKTLNDNHRFSATLDHKIDSFNSIRFTNSTSLTENNAFTKSSTKTLNAASLLENTGERTNKTDGSGMSMQNSLLWRHRFAKKGRNLTTNFQYNLSDNEQNGNLDAVNEFYRPNGTTSSLLRRDATIQTDNRLTERSNYGVTATFVEPLSRRTYLEFNYSYNRVNNDTEREVDTLRNGEKTRNTALSNIFNNDFTYNRGGIGLRYAKKELNVSGGVNYQHSLLRGQNVSKNEAIKPNPFKNFLPNLRFRYEFAQAHSASFDYDANVREPSIDQLQPIVDNSDPLNVSEGNPNLKPEYSNRIRMRYNKFNMANMNSIFVNSTINYTKNKIVYNQTIADNFVRTSKPVNVEDALTAMISGNYTLPLSKQWRMSLGTNTGYNKYISLVNSAENLTKTLTAGGNVRLDYRLRDSFDINLNAKVSNNNTKYSLQPNLNRTFLTHDYELGVNWTLPYNFRINSDFNYQFFSGQGFGQNPSIPIWSASMSKYVLKNKRGEIKLSVFDILNKSTGFSRTADANYIQDETITTLRRYAMLSFTYAINPMFGGQGGRGGRGGSPMRIMMN
jgi:Outer membrane protein beta-barrel family/Carboxypeptidase regulatory-like domain